MNDRIVFEDVSKFYGEILGVNRVNLSIPPGVTSLVGPNGSGKTTLMNLMTGLVRPTRGRIRVLDCDPGEPEKLFRILGYSTQFDSFPKGLTGFQFVYSYLRLAGRDSQNAEQLAWRAIERASLTDAATRNVAAYSKGMRQRIRLAQALCHNPRVLVLDEPLNGLDPLVREGFAKPTVGTTVCRTVGCSLEYNCIKAPARKITSQESHNLLRATHVQRTGHKQAGLWRAPCRSILRCDGSADLDSLNTDSFSRCGVGYEPIVHTRGACFPLDKRR